MTPIDPAPILRHLDNGTLVRRKWGDGRKTACLIAAIHPACARKRSASACPATLMPEWLAVLSTWIDDAPSAEAWDGLMRRYANLASRWWRVSPEAWTRLDYTCRRIAVAEARRYAGDDAKVLAAIDGVLSLLDRAIAGDMPTAGEWAASGARAAAAARAWAAWAARASGARAAAWAASASVADAAWAAARAAARAAEAAGEAASDRMISAMLDAIEAEIVAAEGETRP